MSIDDLEEGEALKLEPSHGLLATVCQLWGGGHVNIPCRQLDRAHMPPCLNYHSASLVFRSFVGKQEKLKPN